METDFHIAVDEYQNFAQEEVSMTLQKYGNPTSSTILLQMVDDHDLAGIESEIAEIHRLTERDFCLIAVKVQDWNNDLSPWPAPAVFGKEGFGGGAPEIIEHVLEICCEPDKTYIIGGYSLSALFALWAAYQTDIFAAVAAASPSMWFPGFMEYMKDNKPDTKCVYLSLGDKEEKTRNPVMATVGDKTREVKEILEEQEIETILEWNQGNHFKDADVRTAKGFVWAMNQICMMR